MSQYQILYFRLFRFLARMWLWIIPKSKLRWEQQPTMMPGDLLVIQDYLDALWNRRINRLVKWQANYTCRVLSTLSSFRSTDIYECLCFLHFWSWIIDVHPFSGALMQEIAHATFTFEHFPEVMTMLWKRMLQDNKSNWRRTYKVC